MWRTIHSCIGVILSGVIMILAITGSLLATQPIYNAVTLPASKVGLSVAQVLENIYHNTPDIEPTRLQRDESGQITLDYLVKNRPTKAAVAPTSGALLEARPVPPFYIFIKDLHRSFTFDTAGRALAAIGALGMGVLCLSGTALLLRRIGGLKQLFSPIRSRSAAGLHSIVGRALLIPLLMTSLTAIWLAGVTFDLIGSGSDHAPSYPESLEELDPVPPWTLHALTNIRISDVKDIVFPIPEDWFDVWAIKTEHAYIFVDQFTGDVLSKDPLPSSTQIYDYIYFLHTAEGSWPWAILLLISSLGVPFFAITGLMIWWRNRRSGRGAIKGNSSAANAETLILVGSESGATWGFAKALLSAEQKAGIPARLAAMNNLRPSYPKLKTCLILTSTYGDGIAPKSATRFIASLNAYKGAPLQHATLAFGDKAFPNFCAFGQEVDAVLTQKFGSPIVPLCEVDKQSAQSFAQWGEALSPALDRQVDLQYEPKRPKTATTHLTEKTVYGADIGAATTVLRFASSRLTRHRPGDLLEIYPPDSATPRLYSIGSCSKADQFLEICVRHVKGGHCSSWLCALDIGAPVQIAIRTNERFQLPRKKPVVMIGAGTGIAPFSGMIRNNTSHRPFDLFWGGRDPASDWLYEAQIRDWLADKRLNTFTPAWSRHDTPSYVQDQLKEAHAHLRQRLQNKATIMVCGGTAMAQAARAEIEIVAAQLGTSVTELKRQNRYLEDVY